MVSITGPDGMNPYSRCRWPSQVMTDDLLTGERRRHRPDIYCPGIDHPETFRRSQREQPHLAALQVECRCRRYPGDSAAMASR
jgi:hypothetical protein